jgi:ABC-type transport system involved in multi-copper enzyme maturation permease subunit
MYRYIWQKEILGELYTWKSMLWLVIASLLLSFTSYLLLTNKELSLLDQTEMMWLLSKVILGVAFLIVTIDASSIISTEFETETAGTLFLSPLRLRDFILGKLLASLTLWLSVFVVSIPYILVTAAGSRLALPFIGYVMLLGTLGAGGLIMLVFGLSLLFRSTKNVLTTSLIILLALSVPALFPSTLKHNAFFDIVGNVNPIDNVFACLDNVLVDYQVPLTANLKYIWPLLTLCVLSFLFMLLGARQFQRKGIIRAE